MMRLRWILPIMAIDGLLSGCAPVTAAWPEDEATAADDLIVTIEDSAALIISVMSGTGPTSALIDDRIRIQSPSSCEFVSVTAMTLADSACQCNTSSARARSRTTTTASIGGFR